MKYNQRLIVVCSLLALPGLIQAQDVLSMKLGSHVIALGMPAREALADVKEDFNVSTCSPPSPIDPLILCSWVLWERDTGEAVGTIVVRNNRVIQISRLLFDRELKSTQDVFDALFEAASSFPKRSSCTVSTDSIYGASDVNGKHSSGAQVVINLWCGQSGVALERNTFGEGSGHYEAWWILGMT
jgi:hypothetical protein